MIKLALKQEQRQVANAWVGGQVCKKKSIASKVTKYRKGNNASRFMVSYNTNTLNNDEWCELFRNEYQGWISSFKKPWRKIREIKNVISQVVDDLVSQVSM